MKNSTFALLAVLGASMLGGSAWLIRRELTRPAGAPAIIQESAASPLEGYTLLCAAGASYDSDLNQWSFCDETTLLGESGAPVYAFMDGEIRAVSLEEKTLTLESAEGGRIVYTNVAPALWTGARCKAGDVIAYLCGDILTLRAEKNGEAIDALALLP